jgi:pimeloyl-ACP methyl ester carboxylesterase
LSPRPNHRSSTDRIDRAFLAEHREFRDGEVREVAGFVPLGGERCYALFHLPPQPRGPGFVVAHSTGLEFITMRRVERAVARALAAAGHPVLFIHRRGFGDSTGSEAEATLDRQVEDLDRAGELLSRAAGTTGLGLVGVGFGGLVAGETARRGAQALVLVNPVLRGAAHFRRLLKDLQLVRMSSSDSRLARSGDDILEELRRTGVTDILGFPVYRHLYEAASAADLVADVGRFEGRALVVWATKRTSPPPDVEGFRQRVIAAGGTCEVRVVQEPAGTQLGTPSWGNVTDPTVRIDRHVPMEREIADLVRGWASS